MYIYIYIKHFTQNDNSLDIVISFGLCDITSNFFFVNKKTTYFETKKNLCYLSLLKSTFPLKSRYVGLDKFNRSIIFFD